MKRAIKKRREELLTKMKQRRSITLQRAIELQYYNHNIGKINNLKAP